VFKNIILKKGSGYGLRYHYYPKQDTLCLLIPEGRLNEYDLQDGIVHEITEAFLRKIVKQLENYFLDDDQMDRWVFLNYKNFEEPFHAVTTLSGERYDLVAHYYDYLEDQFRKAQLSHSSLPKDGFFKS
jgi:hypothetical protein